MQGRRGIAIEARRPGVVLVSVFAGVVLLDQAIKMVVRDALLPGQSVPVIEGVFYLTYVRNTGAAFGLMPGQRALFVTTAVIVLAAIALYWWRARPRSIVLAISLGLVAGGAVGNLIDRVFVGRVTDFFDFLVWPVFNIADIGIVAGAIGLFLWALLAPVEQRETTADPIASSAETNLPEDDVRAPTPEDRER